MRLNQYELVQRAQSYYYQKELPEVNRGLQELRKAHWQEYSAKRELWLSQQIEHLRWAQKVLNKAYDEISAKGVPYREKKWLVDTHKKAEGLLKYYHSELKWVRGKGEGITEEMKETARNYPIEQIVEVNRSKMARCASPDHNDSKPSMYVKNNYAYCFSCGYQADPIKLAMDVNGWDFVTAVQKLS